MITKKRDLIALAFEEIGIANYVYDISPSQWQSALKRMDVMVAGWNANGIRIAYPLPSYVGGSDLDQDVPVPDYALETIISNLAIRLAPSYGKVVSEQTKMVADTSYYQMCNQSALPTPLKQLPQEMPRGAGLKPWRNYNNPFLNKPVDPLLAGSDDEIELS